MTSVIPAIHGVPEGDGKIRRELVLFTQLSESMSRSEDPEVQRGNAKRTRGIGSEY
jgi:hypothetical protein